MPSQRFFFVSPAASLADPIFYVAKKQQFCGNMNYDY